VIGYIVDGSTGDALAGATIVEMGSEPLNAATQAEGGFLVRPQRWPTQLFSWEKGALHSALVLTKESYRRAGAVRLSRWTEPAGLAWHTQTFGSEWAEGVGVVIVELDAPDPAALEGVAASIGASSLQTWVIDSGGSAQPGHTLTKSPAKPWVLWTGVAPGPTTVSVSPHPGLTCTGATSAEILARSVTRVRYVCKTVGS